MQIQGQGRRRKMGKVIVRAKVARKPFDDGLLKVGEYVFIGGDARYLTGGLWFVEHVNQCAAYVRCVVGVDAQPGEKMMVAASRVGYRIASEEERPAKDYGLMALEAKQAREAEAKAARKRQDAQLSAAIVEERRPKTNGLGLAGAPTFALVDGVERAWVRLTDEQQLRLTSTKPATGKVTEGRRWVRITRAEVVELSE